MTHARAAHFMNAVTRLGEINIGCRDIGAARRFEHCYRVLARFFEHLVFILTVAHVEHREWVTPFIALAFMKRYPVVWTRELFAERANTNAPRAWHAVRLFKRASNARNLSAGIAYRRSSALEAKATRVRLVRAIKVCIARNINSATGASPKRGLVVKAA